MKYLTRILFVIILFCNSGIVAQTNNTEQLKKQALLLMKDQRYGEAVDQLNKYISANPRSADGYHLRGLCFENRIQYANSVYDLRQAIRLEPSNTTIRTDLYRVLEVWHAQLYLKIDGHKRDLAIDPKRAFSYLEIGKSYRWLEKWFDAEYWYDEYLKRDDNASPDEIIRYTEILARTLSIVKGEKILKKYVERYPDDWRLWSRYGYFTLWLSKYKIAEDAFLQALSFKPYFKEAEDGLDLARKKGYLTAYQGGYDTRNEIPQEYPIDRLTRIINNNPNDNDNNRFELTRLLIEKDRYEEAFQQLQYLSQNYKGEAQFDRLWEKVTTFRDSSFNKNVEVYTERLKNNPSDKEAVLKLAEAYGNLFYYDSSLEVLSEYLVNIPPDQDLDVRFKLAQYAAWNYEWERAISELESLLNYDPGNLDYKLLRAQIATWTVNDLDIAEGYLRDYLDKYPNNVNAILTMSSLYAWQKDMVLAREYLDRAKVIAPTDKEVIAAESNFQLRIAAVEEGKIFAIRGEAGTLAMSGNCEAALEKYDEFKSKRTGLTIEELKEYTDIAICAKEYNKAISAYDEILAQGFDYRTALQRAKCYFLNGDSTLAYQEFESISKQQPDDDASMIFLADTYSSANRLPEAEAIYRKYKGNPNSPLTEADWFKKMIILSDSYLAAKNFEKAKSIYEEVNGMLPAPELLDLSDSSNVFIPEQGLDVGYGLFSSNVDLRKEIESRKIYMGDLLIQNNQLDDAENLFNELEETLTYPDLKNELFTKKMFLGDAFVMNQEFGRAKDAYYDAMDMTNDTAQVRMINERMSWLPATGFNRGLSSVGGFLMLFVPTNLTVSPSASYYRDNQNLSFYNYGARLESGFAGFLGLGFNWSRINISTNIVSRYFTQMKGIGTLFLSQYVSVYGEYGINETLNEKKSRVWGTGFRYTIPETFNLSGSYEFTDARFVLYSPNLIDLQTNIGIYRVAATYNYKKITLLSANYNYYNLSDGNEGNDFIFRFGRQVIQDLMVGYEFYFSDYGYNSNDYYSPQEFDSHSLWGEWSWFHKENLKGKISGKIGYVPDVDFMISEISGEVVYNLFSNFIITARLGYGNSFRYDSSYKNLSAVIYAYWGVF